MAFGRDAADVSLTHTFGSAWLQDFRVWTDEIPELPPAQEPAVAGALAAVG